MFELHHLSATEQLDGLRRGDWTPRDLAEHHLARVARLDAGLGAFATVTGESALARADAVLRDVPRSAALWGLPTADKDLVARAGVPTGYGSRAVPRTPAETSDPLALALDEAGAVSLGKTAVPEFGLPAYTEPLAGPIARNPYDPTLGAGGSSGGAAVAVAAGMLPVALGSDGGGSVRVPAAATGLVGLKFSRGRAPAGSGFDALAGLVAPGALARTVADAGLLLDALAPDGPATWATVAPRWDGGPFLGAAARGEGRYSIGIWRDSPWAGEYDIRIAPEATEALDLAVRELDALGHGIEELPPAEEPGYSAAFRTIWQAGAAAIPVDGPALADVEPLTAWLIDRGRALGAREVVEALAWLVGYEQRTVARFAAVDAVLSPVLARTPPPVGYYDPADGERNFAQQVEVTPFTSPANVAGLPAISLPVATTADGIPMAVQLVGRPGREDVLLAIGAQLERRVHWELRHPPGW